MKNFLKNNTRILIVLVILSISFLFYFKISASLKLNFNPSFPRGAEFVKLNEEKILAIGGYFGEYSKPVSVPHIYIYNPKTGIIKKGQDVLYPRVFHSATLLNDGRIFVAGGNYMSKVAACVTITEFYNPKTNKFEKGPELENCIPSHKAVRMSDGNVILIGGLRKYAYDGLYDFDYNPDILMLNVKTNKIEKIVKLVKPRFGFKTYQKDDKIYIKDGWGAGNPEADWDYDHYYSKNNPIEEFDYKTKTIRIVDKLPFEFRHPFLFQKIQNIKHLKMNALAL